MRSLIAVCLNIIFTIFKDYYLLGQIMNDFMMRLLNRIFGICQFCSQTFGKLKSFLIYRSAPQNQDY